MDSSEPIQVQVPDEAYWRSQIKCQQACPVHTDARGYVRAIAAGEFEEAYLIARGPNPLASICGRVCGAPCEAACRRGDVDESISIRALKRFVTSQFGTESNKFNPLELLGRVLKNPRQCSAPEELKSLQKVMRKLESPCSDGPKVAIIGSGPAGLAAAHDLALLGMRPVVFEMEPIPAGMLAVGIPSYRLPRDLIKAEVALIEALGVEFRCNVQVGKDIAFDQIRKDHAATIIAVGAKKSRKIPIEGGDSRGILGGVEFLRDVSLDRPVELGAKVVVIGGGNVAYDVSRSVIRQATLDISRSALRKGGVSEVHMVSLESLDELPADDVEILEGDEEGVIRHHRLGPARIIADKDGSVQAIDFKRVLRVFDEKGKFSPQFDDDDVTRIEADTVIWSIGQAPDLSFVPEGDIPRNQRGLIDCDPITFATQAPDVFLAGDIAYGPKLLIHAVASGKQVARSVHHYLTQNPLQSRQTMVHLPVLNYKREADYEKIPRQAVPTLPPQQRKTSKTIVVETGFDRTQAMCEAGRCLDCGINTIFDSDKCILCGGCADVCPELCLRLVSVEALASDAHLDAALEARFEPGEASQASAIIKDETACIRCALCAERCPVGAITMDRMTFENQWTEVVET